MIATVVQFSRIYLLLNIFVFTQAEVVLTEYGFIESNLLLMSVTGEQYHAFRGIPYASPPIGKLRFQVKASFLSYYNRKVTWLYV